MVGGARQHEGTRRDQPERERHQAGLDRDPPMRVLEAVPHARDKKCQQAGRAAHLRGGDAGAGKTRHVVSDQSDDDDVRSGRYLRDREHVGELAVVHPMHHLDGNAVHFRDRRIGAADREQRQQREIAGERGERGRVHRLNHAKATLNGASPRNTQGSGQCMSATPVKARIANTGAEFQRLTNSGAAILATTAISRPTAAAVMPARMRLSVSRPPKRSYKIASTMTIIRGGTSSPASATAAPAGPPKRAPNTTEKLITFGPGRNCESAKVSLNSSVVIQRFCPTIMRRAHGSTPPKAEIDTPAKARNSSASEGCKAGGGAAGSDICREGLHRRGAHD